MLGNFILSQWARETDYLCETTTYIGGEKKSKEII